MRSDDSRLENLIGAAFDRLPDPDSTRLREIEERVARCASRGSEGNVRRRSFWWLIAALTATGAAAWWGGEYLGREPSPAPATQQIDLERVPATTERIRDNRTQPVAPAAPDGGQREIYRRERY